MINADKPHLWKDDIKTSVDHFNQWFLDFAPQTFRDSRKATSGSVMEAIAITNNLRNITNEQLKEKPGILSILRMATAPPLARDRLVGLAHSKKNLVNTMEKEGILPPRMRDRDIDRNLEKICKVLQNLIDIDIFTWIVEERDPTINERERASTIIADRLCGAVANPIIRNAQEKRQLNRIKIFLESNGYQYREKLSGTPLRDIKPGLFTFRMNVAAGENMSINIPVDVLIQPHTLSHDRLPILIEAKSAGDFTNVNKRRKEEATKIRQLKQAYGPETRMILFLCGYFDAGYLGYEAAEGLDWIWEHRIADMKLLGL